MNLKRILSLTLAALFPLPSLQAAQQIHLLDTHLNRLNQKIFSLIDLDDIDDDETRNLLVSSSTVRIILQTDKWNTHDFWRTSSKVELLTENIINEVEERKDDVDDTQKLIEWRTSVRNFIGVFPYHRDRYDQSRHNINSKIASVSSTLFIGSACKIAKDKVFKDAKKYDVIDDLVKEYPVSHSVLFGYGGSQLAEKISSDLQTEKDGLMEWSMKYQGNLSGNVLSSLVTGGDLNPNTAMLGITGEYIGKKIGKSVGGQDSEKAQEIGKAVGSVVGQVAAVTLCLIM